ncbi:hypothetical protein Gasu2_40850 [Galdieria sulphuraria]|uniref:Uncharacterized protein n=1 Tax=Galdieria sulphuraria TaxID=130081 RepID=M2Y834_GALSU|nr:uncharacterized protein Gasu_07410 [Galdieria sulphuraria]EME31994.1 hypothetical protein Gasu_07410 [Galdieria sulphuraria]GJD09861.1 hypothetical protein Gasu2_40850 [Galdieria sulphuraria]|eukprot:XP_005708514.1 hypothetical protein Gasu_07410 [Galdieria sulphuraria]
MLCIKQAEVLPFQSEVFAPFKLILSLDNQVDGLLTDLVVRYVRDCSQRADSREVFVKKRILMNKGPQEIVCENISLCFLKEFRDWEYCNVGYLEVMLLSEEEKKVLISLNLVIQIFTDRQYSGALKQVYSYFSTFEEVHTTELLRS